MFRKQIEKIEKKGGVIPTLSPDSRQTFGSHGPGVASPVSPGSKSFREFSPGASNRNSLERTSVSSEFSDKISDASSKEELVKKIIKNHETIRILESKVAEFAAIIKDKQKAIEKTDTAHKKEKEELGEKLIAKEEKLTEDLQRTKTYYEKTVAQMEGVVKDLKQQLARVTEQGKPQLTEQKLQHQIQELTQQVKSGEKSSRAHEDECRRLQSELNAAVERNQELAEEVNLLMEQISSATQASESSDQALLQLRRDKKALETQVEEQSLQASELHRVQEELAEVQGKYQSLQHNTHVSRQKMSRLVEEKDELISQLKERVETLDQRIQAGSLSNDERLNALQEERSGLEHKLWEAREQLSQVKSSWSDKISHLEEQITHLNQQMAEEGEEALSQQRAAHQNNEKLQAQVHELQSRLDDANKQVREAHREAKETQEKCHVQNSEHESKLLQLKLHYSDLETELRSKVNDLQQEMAAQTRLKDQEKLNSQKKLAQLQSQQSEWLEKEIELERKTTQLEESVQSALEERDKLSVENEKINKSLTDTEKKMSELKQEFEQLNSAKSQAAQNHSDLQQTNQELSKERDELMVRNAQLRQEVDVERRGNKCRRDDLEAELQQRNHAVAGLEQVLQDMQAEASHHKRRINELESQQVVAITELESAEISRLRQQLQAQEDAILERNKTIKKLQQRVADFKKTLQRELNVQSLPNDSFPFPDQDVSPYHSDSQQNDQPAVLSITSSSSYSNLRKPNGPGRPDGREYAAEPGPRRPYPDVDGDGEEVNYSYLKHVLLKFLLSRETEAVHLVKALSTLLKMSHDEEELLLQILNYKMSWFGTKPNLGEGQFAKIIPPS